MKKILALIIVAALMAGLALPVSAADARTERVDITYRGISIVLEGKEIIPADEKGNPTEPFIMNGSTYLPVRAVANALGLGVEWIAATSTVALTSGGEVDCGSGEKAASNITKTVDISYRGTKISLDGKQLELVNAAGDSVEPFILDGTNYLPLRAVGEALGLEVGWDSATSTVSLREKAAERVWMPGSVLVSGGETGGSLSQLGELKYSYDGLGRLTRMYSTDGSIELGCVYHESGAPAQLDFRVPGVSTSHRWDYGEDGEAVAYYRDGQLMEGYSCERDAEGRIIKEYITEDGYSKVNEYTYDGEGNVATEKLGDMGGLIFEYKYDKYGRVIHKFERDPNFPDNGGAEYFYSYDSRGNLIKTEQFNHYMGYGEYVREYSYDSLGRLTEELCTWFAPYGGDNALRTSSKYVYSYEYDELGNVSKYEEATYFNELYDGGVSFYLFELWRETYSYDDGGRLLSAEFYSEPPGDAFTEDEQYYYSYNAAGQTTGEKYIQFIGGDKLLESEYKYSYDAAGRLTYESWVETTLDGSRSYQQSYSYNAKGEPLGSSYTDSEGNSSYEQYVYNHLGQAVSHTLTENGAVTKTTVEYNGEGLPSRTETVVYGEGITVVTEMSYVLVPPAEMDAFLAALVEQIEAMLQ